MGFGSKCSILNEQVIYTENSKLNIADMWLIPLDRVTYGAYIPLYTLDELVRPKIYLFHNFQINILAALIMVWYFVTQTLTWMHLS